MAYGIGLSKTAQAVALFEWIRFHSLPETGGLNSIFIFFLLLAVLVKWIFARGNFLHSRVSSMLIKYFVNISIFDFIATP